MNKSTVAILGLGAMGVRMAANLLDAGYTLRVWNRTPGSEQSLVERGAIACVSPREAAKEADVVIAMLTDDDASRVVWLDSEVGAIHGFKSGAVAIECSTLSPAWCGELADQINNSGADFLEAPIVGSRPQMEAHQIIHLVAGENDTLGRVRNVLETSASAIHYTGAVGTAMTMKLAINMLFATQVAALAEVLGVLGRAEMPIEKAVSLLNELPTTSPALKGIGTLISSGNYEPLFPVSLVKKDLGYFTQFAQSLCSERPLAMTVYGRYKAAIEKGYGANHISGVARLSI